MDSSMRRAAVAGLTLLLGLSACGGPPPEPTDVSSDVDRQRAHFLSSESILDMAVSPPEVSLGMVHSSKVGWDRTEIAAELYKTSGGTTPDPAVVEQEFARATARLREADWTIHWEMCLPPPTLDLMGNEVDPVTIPIPVPRADGYEWLAAGYKVVGGVSYAVLVIGIRGMNTALVDVLLRAPNARDAANLYPDAPSAVATGQTCAEDGKVGDTVEKAGTPTMMRDWWPYPTQTHARDPNQV